jgi:uncharacterized RDD family membrane protein YckC
VPQAALAGFWTRAGAYLIDGLLVSLFWIPAIIAFAAGPTHYEACTFRGEPAICEVPDGSTVAIGLLLCLAALLAGLIYFAKLEGGPSGQTLGKKALGIAVVDETTGWPIGTGRGVGRYFARFLSNFLFGLGYLWMLWDPRKQTWHDKLAKSVVVRR